MSTSFIFLSVIFLLGIAMVIYKYMHRQGLHNDVDKLRSVIDNIFKENEDRGEALSQNRLIKGLKHHMGINEKMALKLIGKARHEDLITLDTSNLKEKNKIKYKKNF